MKRIRMLLMFVLLIMVVIATVNATESPATISPDTLRQIMNAAGLTQDDSFMEVRSGLDEKGRTHIRYNQYYKGIRVYGAQMVVHLDEQMAVTELTDGVQKQLSLITAANISQSEAIDVGLRDFAVSKSDEMLSTEAELVIFRPEETEPVLAYRVRLQAVKNGFPVSTDYMIDALNGNIVTRMDSLKKLGVGHSQYEGTVDLNTSYNSSTNEYGLRDHIRSTDNRTMNLNHATSGSGSLYHDADNIWGDYNNYTGGSTTSANGQTAGADVHYGLQIIWDYFKIVHLWNGLDGAAGPVDSRVHYGTGIANAYWDLGDCNCATFGDGGGSYGTITSLDAVGHEYTHGYSEQIIGSPGFVGLGEPAAIDETTSDIFGTMAEFWANTAASGNQPTGDPGDWTLGENIGPITRYMNKPSTNGKGADYWSGCLHAQDPHFANGPANHFFYYLSTGVPTTGSNASPYLPAGMAGITRAKAEKIWFRALFVYMTASTRYLEARQATLNAARDLYGNPSTEYTAVNNAWIAVNVTSASIPVGGCSPQGHGPYPF